MEPSIIIILVSTLITNLTLIATKVKKCNSGCCSVEMQESNTATGRTPKPSIDLKRIFSIGNNKKTENEALSSV